jgi:hypothetical protein
MSDAGRSRVRIESLAQVFAVLAEAAELEHGIMCCYLYSAFGLKSEPSDGLPPDQAAAVKRWRDTLIGVAVEEMSHLALVSNLMVALGARPHFNRQNLPVPPGYHPADIRLVLAPFDLDTLDHFIFLERPEGSHDADPASFATGPHYARETAAGRFFPAGSDYATIGGLYRDLAAALAKLAGRLGERALFSGAPDLQVGPETVSLPGLLTIGSLADAAQAVDNVVRQGEGAPGHDEHSHYGRFVAMRDEYQAILAKDPNFTPSRPTARNPVMRRPPEPAGFVYVDHPEAAAALDAANAAYNLMLLCLAQAYARPRGSDPSEKTMLLNAAIGLMHGVMKLGVALTYLPVSAEHPGVNAGLTFSAPRALPPLIHNLSEWKILSYGILGVAQGVADLKAVPDAAGIAKGLAAIAASFP